MPSLAHLVRSSSSHGVPFDARAACAIAGQLCAQLERPHGAVAPSAIQVDWDGSVSLDRSGHAPSSALPYMAPERLAGADPDARSDVHAVAMVLLELVTGRPVRREAGLTFSGNLPVELVELLDRSSSQDPGRRHSSPREMAAWLALAEEESGGAMSREELAGWLAERFGRGAVPPTRAISVVAGRRWRLGAIAGILALAGAGTAVLARTVLTGSAGDDEPAAPMVIDTPAGDSTMKAPGAMSPSMAAGSMASAMAAGSMGSESMAPSAPSVNPLPVASSMASSMIPAAPEPARKQRRKRSRAARKSVAQAGPAAARDADEAPDAKMAPAAAPPSCPMSQAANTMAPVASDAMSPDTMSPLAKEPAAKASRSRPSSNRADASK